MNKTILIAGGAGYVGTKMTEIFLKNKFKVICLDNLVYGKESIKPFLKKKGYKFFKGDVRDQSVLNYIFNEKINFVVNLASIVGDRQCKIIPKSAYDINVNGNIKLFKISKKKKVDKYIFASTCSNYGISNPKKYARENSELFPVSLYAETKIDCENYLLKNLNNNMSTIILRFATAFGVSYRTRFDLTVNSFTYEALKYKELMVFGEDTWRPFIHVYDMANVVLKLINFDKENLNGEIFNVGFTEENFTKKDLINKILKFLPKTKVTYNSNIIDRRNYKVSCDKLKKRVNIKINNPVDFGIKEIIKAYINKKLKESHIKNNLIDKNCKILQDFYGK